MMIEEMIAVMVAYRDGKRIQYQHHQEIGWRDAATFPTWNFFNYDYRVAPEPHKPREYWIEPLKHGLCRIHETEPTDGSALWHVRLIE